MRKYDFKKAKTLILACEDRIEVATMGMHEDWWWTATQVFCDGSFLVDLDDDELKISGISGSAWATPVLEITLKDGTTTLSNCFVGEADMEKPEWFKLGPLSEPIQEVREEKLNDGEN